MSDSNPLRSLQAMCEAHREEIIESWNRHVQALPQFRSTGPEETRANVTQCFDAFYAHMTRADSAPLGAFVEALARRRFETGFEIDAPLAAASRFRAAIREVFRARGGNDLPDAAQLREALSHDVDAEVDAFNSGFSSAFARLLVEDSSTRLRELFDDAFDVLMRVAPDGAILEANARVKALFGFDTEAWLERPWTELFADAGPRGDQLLRRIFAGEALHAQFVDVRRADGSSLRCVLHGHRSRAAGAEEAIVVLRDMSREEALRAQVIQSEKLASIGQLSATVAHELNNPLAWMLGNLEQLRALIPKAGIEGSMRGHIDEALDDALAGVERMTDIVADLKSFARTDRGEDRRVDVQEVIELALRISDAQIGHRIRVYRDYADLPPIVGRPGRLSQVFVNLFVNGAQAMQSRPARENRLEIRTRVEGESILVDVIDNGPGIDAKRSDSIFAPFVTTKGAAGTGLGLWVCRNIVHEHGGELILMDASEAADTGAHFRISLPLPTSKPMPPPPT